ncbi:MAG: hypothetical protein KDD25_05770 [Bdellovibrionales bacterium]|nr:hypothetical protein [Bdellovibrionales bacterium]
MSSSGSMTPSSNKLGIKLFLLVFVATLILFAFVMIVNKGPLDQTMWENIPTFTPEEKIARDVEWRKSTAEAIAEGEKLYEINVFGPRAPVFDEVLAGKHGTNPVQIYRVLTHGIPGTELRKMDFLPQSVRWKMTHYIVSKLSGATSAGESDWKALDAEGI